jgi:hypothetical protein
MVSPRATQSKLAAMNYTFSVYTHAQSRRVLVDTPREPPAQGQEETCFEGAWYDGTPGTKH